MLIPTIDDAAFLADIVEDRRRARRRGRRLDDKVGAAAAGHFAELLDGAFGGRVEGLGGAELLGDVAARPGWGRGR